MLCVLVQVGFSNHAILMLCGALSEMAKRVGINNGRYVKELENLSRSVHSLPAGGMGALGGGMGAAMVSVVFVPLGLSALYDALGCQLGRGVIACCTGRQRSADTAAGELAAVAFVHTMGCQQCYMLA